MAAAAAAVTVWSCSSSLSSTASGASCSKAVVSNFSKHSRRGISFRAGSVHIHIRGAVQTRPAAASAARAAVEKVRGDDLADVAVVRDDGNGEATRQKLEQQLERSSGSNALSMEPGLSASDLVSTPFQRLIVGTSFGLALLVALRGAYHDGRIEIGLGTVAVTVAAYVLSDLASGIYHWSVDNYGSGATPIVGGQIAAFQGHHKYPWTITRRQFANNVHKVCIPTIPFLLAFLALPVSSPAANTFIATFVPLIVLSQQFHAWAHCRKSDLSPPVLWLQDRGLVVSRKAHGAHHRPPFEGNYSIVNGMWNDVLDRSGTFRRAEEWIHAKTGVRPRCWDDTPEQWLEDSKSS
eukprot:jgi/Chlat1/6224/Chrsp44S05812